MPYQPTCSSIHAPLSPLLSIKATYKKNHFRDKRCIAQQAYPKHPARQCLSSHQCFPDNKIVQHKIYGFLRLPARQRIFEQAPLHPSLSGEVFSFAKKHGRRMGFHGFRIRLAYVNAMSTPHQKNWFIYAQTLREKNVTHRFTHEQKRGYDLRVITPLPSLVELNGIEPSTS